MTTFKSITLAAFLALASAPLALTLAPTAALAQNGGNGGGGGGGGAGAGGNSNDGIYDMIRFDAERREPRAFARAEEPNNTIPRFKNTTYTRCAEGRRGTNYGLTHTKFKCNAR
jgi:hypothetical protein